MKKNIIVLMLIVCMVVSACGNSNGENTDKTKLNENGEIQLSSENYSQYLDVTVNAYANGPDGLGWKFDRIFGGDEGYMYPQVYVWLQCKGKSSIFNYNNIQIKVKVSGSYLTVKAIETINEVDIKTETKKTEDFKTELEIKGDIVGNGESLETIKLPSYYYASDKSVTWKMESIEVSGTVTPA